MCIHAHFDDYELAGAGIFELFRKQYAPDFKAKIIVCSDGKGGHHFRSREETGQIRLEEQKKSAKIGQYEFDVLKLLDGSIPREATLNCNVPFLAALWKCIRDFEPDYLFCPGLARDTSAGIHIDHEAVAEGIRKIAYMINVPHAFSPEYPEKGEARKVKVPVILNFADEYHGTFVSPDFFIDITEAFDVVCKTSFCHQSQINEWLPWVDCHFISSSKDLQGWKQNLKETYKKMNRRWGLKNCDHPMEGFNLTQWGSLPTEDFIDKFSPYFDEQTDIKRLKTKIESWTV